MYLSEMMVVVVMENLALVVEKLVVVDEALVTGFGDVVEDHM